jgi:selenocysteine-specific elongation factor
MHVIGTAGHVDHGKSTLVRALTGIDPDRLAEEKEREMTIDLGFAWFQLGEDEVGVVDVPGHRDFIENMLAGVGGIDLALFVIAADEGVMPQTREHLAILDLLGVRSGIVALTKIDLIDDPEWIELVSLEISEALAGSTLADAPIVPVSARTGAGLDDLTKRLAEALGRVEPRLNSGHPRLPIDRVFTLSGFGTVVTGTLLDGSLRVGDAVEVAPQGLSARIRGLQTHKTKRDIAQPGSRVAINLTGVDYTDLHRGQVVAQPRALRPTTLLDVAYRHLPDARQPLKHHADIKLFIGAAEVSGRARVLGQERIEPGQTGWLQLALTESVAVVRGDRFILRRPSPGETIGGGTVLDSNPGRRHRRFRPEVLARLEALQAGTPADVLMQTLLRAGPMESARVFERAGLKPAESVELLSDLVAEGQVRQVGKYLVATATWGQLMDRAEEGVSAYHAQSPLRLGMSREELRSRLQLPPPVFGPLVEALVAEDRLVDSQTLLRRPFHEVVFSAEQQQQIDRLLVLLRKSGVNSPSVKECREMVGDTVYTALVERGDLVQINPEIVYDTAEYRELMALLQGHLAQHGAITAAGARDLLTTSRKYAIALLEHLDEIRVTRRVGDERILIADKSA